MDKINETRELAAPTTVQPLSLLQEACHDAFGSVFGEKSSVTGAATKYLPEALYTAALFFPGGKATVAAAAIGAANEVHRGESLKDGLTDAALGAVKGGLTKYAFDQIAPRNFLNPVLNAPLKGVIMGSTSRLINVGLSRSSYEGSDGSFNLGEGLAKTASSVVSRDALLMDAATFTLASGASAGLNKVTGGLLERSPGLSTLLTGSSFGFVSGGTQELLAESKGKNGIKDIDWGKVAGQAATWALVDGLAAGPAAARAGFTPAPMVQPESRAASQKEGSDKKISASGYFSENNRQRINGETGGHDNRAQADLRPIRSFVPALTEAAPSPAATRLQGEGGIAGQSTESADGVSDGGPVKPQFRSPNGKRLWSPAPLQTIKTVSDTNTSVSFSAVAKQLESESGYFTPVKVKITDPSGRNFSITSLRERVWNITDPNGSSFSAQADISVSKDGKNMSIAGKAIDLTSATADDIAIPFFIKPDISSKIDPQFNEMKQILRPLDDPQASLDEANKALSDIHYFARSHRSPALETMIKDWMPYQSPQIRSILSRYYEDPVAADVRRSSYLRDTAISHLRQEDGLSSGTFQQITDFTTKIDGSKMLSDNQKQQTIENVVGLLDDGNDPKLSQEELVSTTPRMFRTAALQMAMHAADPDTITQFAHPTCALASLEVQAYTRTPESATDLVSQVLRTGRYVTQDGTVISIDPFSLHPDLGSDSLGNVNLNQYQGPDAPQYRSYASQIFQTTAANIYWQTQTEAPDGAVVPKGSLRYELQFDPHSRNPKVPTGYIVDYSESPPARWEAGGYTPDQISLISDQISAKLQASRVPVESLDTIETFRSWLDSQPEEKMPMSIGVDARYLSPDLADEPDIQGHAISVHGSFDPAVPRGSNKFMAAIKNPWKGRMEFKTVDELYKMTYARPGFTGPQGQTSEAVVAPKF